MCGIVGYSGKLDAVNPVMTGLERLEYRGYDSAGISFNDNGTLRIIKKEGKLKNLSDLLSAENVTTHQAIGHTRWATHGAVTTDNAHPHGDENISVVHNGIIENAGAIKKELISEGYKFLSQTDSEVFVVLLKKYLKEFDIKEAIIKAFKKIDGNSAFVIMKKGDPNLYGIKRSAPLAAGYNSEAEDVYLSSDPYALIGYVDKVFFPEDEVLLIGSPTNHDHRVDFFELDGSESSRYRAQDQEKVHAFEGKAGFEHYMLKEIYEQPTLVRNLAEKYLNEEGVKKLNKIAEEFKTDFIHIGACGTAWHAGLLIDRYLREYTDARVNVDLASEFRYRDQKLYKTDIGMLISQSGETADTLAVQELCKKEGLKTISIINTEGSTIYRNADENLQIYGGQEVGVASTKAFTLQVLTGYFFASALGNQLEAKKLKEKCEVLARSIEKVLDNREQIQNIAQDIYLNKGFIYTGRGRYFPIALEGALKLKEIAYVHAEGYAAGELKHGPIALIDESMVNIALVGTELYEKTVSNIEEVKARLGKILTIGPENDSELDELSDWYIGLPIKENLELAPLLANVVLQLLSYEIAKLKGTDIDKPRNLAKSVTVE